jgi:RecA-family ATPase
LREYYIQRRFESIREAKGIDCALDNLTVWNLRGHAFDRSAFCSHLLEIIKEDQVRVIFIDPFYKLLNELDNETIRPVWEAFCEP